MGYQEALEAAGAEVMAFESFGSYQGDWLAKVKYDGEVFFIRDYYGSCSGCDAFEAEIGWEPYDETSAEYAEYMEKVKAFGMRYLEPQERLSYDQALTIVSENVFWDSDAEEMVNWVKGHAE